MSIGRRSEQVVDSDYSVPALTQEELDALGAMGYGGGGGSAGAADGREETRRFQTYFAGQTEQFRSNVEVSSEVVNQLEALGYVDSEGNVGHAAARLQVARPILRATAAADTTCGVLAVLATG